jgi:hypothetical protein
MAAFGAESYHWKFGVSALCILLAAKVVHFFLGVNLSPILGLE